MSIVDKLLNFLKNKHEDESIEAPEGFCPNCWGREEYGGKFYEAVLKERVDINKPNEHVGWINDYANTHLLDIHIHDHEGKHGTCSKCNLKYKEV